MEGQTKTFGEHLQECSMTYTDFVYGIRDIIPILEESLRFEDDPFYRAFPKEADHRAYKDTLAGIIDRLKRIVGDDRVETRMSLVHDLALVASDGLRRSAHGDRRAPSGPRGLAVACTQAISLLSERCGEDEHEYYHAVEWRY